MNWQRAFTRLISRRQRQTSHAARLRRNGACRRAAAGALLALLFLSVFPLEARLKQFDVFLGYDGYIPEGNWFPLTFEVQNDGPTFEALIEVAPGQLGRGQIRRLRVELPTGTLKRFVLPAFCAARGYASWDIVVRDANGNKREEIKDLRPKQITQGRVPLFAAIPRSVGGMPKLPEIAQKQSYQQPQMARLAVELLPDNPIALEGLAGIYLNAEKALELKENQAKALLAWLAGGGHLVVGLHQPSDAAAVPWLRDLLPFQASGLRNHAGQRRLENWIEQTTPRTWALDNSLQEDYAAFSSLRRDAVFSQGDLAVVTGGAARGGQILLADGDLPLVISAGRGRGLVTVLTFSPETEPFRSWKSRAFFWAKVFDLPPAWFEKDEKKNQYSDYGGWSVDSVIGAIVDSRQVRKLPIGWLLVLLLGYLAVIGPLDQFVLRKINRPMLTWLTFPAYVLLFSGLIYLIGYKLRAGDVEWNELHIVDVMADGGGGAALRGQAFGSVYSPANARYPLESRLDFASLREEFSGSYGGGAFETTRSVVEQRGNNFVAEVAVPVWTCQLFAGHWWQHQRQPPLTAAVERQAGGYQVRVTNHLPRPLNPIRLVVDGRLENLGELAPQQTRTFTLPVLKGPKLEQRLAEMTDLFINAASHRRSALGSDEHVRPGREQVPDWVMCLSFANSHNEPQGHRRFSASRGFDLSAPARRGEAVVLAWMPNHLLAAPMNGAEFRPRRQQNDTLLRLVTPVN